MQKEEKLQVACIKYVALQYPKVIVNAHLTGIKLPIGLAKKVKVLGSCKSIPDLEILEPTKKYHGCFIELKIEGTRLYKKDGSPATSHIAEQQDMINKLKDKGYYAEFACGFDDFKQQVDHYLES